MFFEHITSNQIYMIVGFLLSMHACISNDIIQTLGTFFTANKKTPFYYMWLFVSVIMILTLSIGWVVNNGDMSFGRLARIPAAQNMDITYILPPIVVLILTKFGIPVATAFLILSVFTIEDISVIGMMLTKSFIGYALAFLSALIIYNIIARDRKSTR